MSKKLQSHEANLTFGEVRAALLAAPPKVGSDQLQNDAGWPSGGDSDRLLAAFAELENKGLLVLSKCKVCPCCDEPFVEPAIDAALRKGEHVRGYIAVTEADLAEAAKGNGLTFHFGVPDEVPSKRFTQVLDALEREIFQALERQGLEAVWRSEQRLWVKVECEQRFSPVTRK